MPTLTLIQTPPEYILLKEGAKIQIAADNPYTAGVKARIVFEFTESEESHLDESFTLSFNGISQEFTFKVNPDNSGLQLHVFVFDSDFEQWIYQIADELRQNYYINKYCLVEVVLEGSYRIAIEAREEGSAYTFTADTDEMTDMAEVAEENVPGTDKTMLDNYRILVEACLHGEQDWLSEVAGTDAITPDNDNKAGFDIASYFASRLITGFTFPKTTQSVPLWPDGCKKIFFRYAEMYGGTVKKLFSRYSFPSYIIKGGLSRQDRQFYADESTDFFSYGDNLKRFLTHRPNNKTTSKDSPERLFFLLTDQYRNISMHVEYMLDTGIGAGREVETLSTEQGSLIELCCGFYELEIPENAIYWEVFLSNASGVEISERYRFIPDNNDFLNTRHFIFRNSFGVYDALYCTGQFEKTGSYERTVISTIDETEFTAHLSRQKVFYPEETQSYSANTGFISKDILDYLRDFLLSEEIWEVRGDILVPVVLTSKQAQMFKDRSHLYSLSFEYEVAWTDQHYSREIGEQGTNFLMSEGNYMTMEGQKLRY
jgi:hypothetical protein